MAIAENLSPRYTRRELFKKTKQYAVDAAFAAGIAGEITASGGLAKWGWEMHQADKLRNQVPNEVITIPHPKNPDFLIYEKEYFPQNQDHELILNKASHIEDDAKKWGKLSRIGFVAMIPASINRFNRFLKILDKASQTKQA